VWKGEGRSTAMPSVTGTEQRRIFVVSGTPESPERTDVAERLKDSYRNQFEGTELRRVLKYGKRDMSTPFQVMRPYLL